MTMTLQKLVAQWKVLLGVASVIGGTATTFLLKPAGLALDDSGGDYFATFCVAIIVSLSVWGVSYLERNRKRLLGPITAILLCCLVVLFLGYRGLLTAWTIQPMGVQRPLVIGIGLLPDASAFATSHGMATNPPSMNDTAILLENAAYHCQSIWTGGLRWRWSMLMLLYVVLISAVCIIVVCSLHLVPRNPSRRTR